MITTFYPPFNFGGDGIFVHRLANELAARGHRVDVIHCMDAFRLLARRNVEQEYDDHPGVTIHGLKSPFGILSPLATHQTGSPFFKSGAIRRILAKGFDVIHYHNISLVGGPKVLEYGSGIKLYTAHEYWLFCPTHLLYRFNRTPCAATRHCILCALMYRIPPQCWRALGRMRRYIGHLDAIIAPSIFCKEIYRRNFPGLPIIHLPNFVSSDGEVLENDPTIQQKGPFFLFVGRLETIKGLQTIIPVFLRYRSARLLVAGAGSCEKKMRKLAAGSDKIRFLGHLESRQLRSLYRQAVAVIVPSLCYEIFPTVIMEAFKESTPTIVRDLGGMPELVRESGGGFIYKTDDELVQAMDLLMNDPGYRHLLGRKAYASYLEKWSADRHINDYLALIEEISAQRKADTSLNVQRPGPGYGRMKRI